MKLSFYQILIHQNRKQKYLDFFFYCMHQIFIERAVFLSGYSMNEHYLAGVISLSLFFSICESLCPPSLRKSWDILRPQSYSMWTTVHISMTRPTIGSNWHVASDVLREIWVWERTGCPFHQLERRPQGGIDWWGPMVWLDPVVCGVTASPSSSSDISKLGDFSARPRRQLLSLSVPLFLSCQRAPSHPLKLNGLTDCPLLALQQPYTDDSSLTVGLKAHAHLNSTLLMNLELRSLHRSTMEVFVLVYFVSYYIVHSAGVFEELQALKHFKKLVWRATWFDTQGPLEKIDGWSQYVWKEISE